MQYKDENTEHLAKVVGQLIKEQRIKTMNCSINKFAHEFDLDVGNISRIENGLTDIKLVTLWKISEALNMKVSDLISLVEKKLGDKFYFHDV